MKIWSNGKIVSELRRVAEDASLAEERELVDGDYAEQNLRVQLQMHADWLRVLAVEIERGEKMNLGELVVNAFLKIVTNISGPLRSIVVKFVKELEQKAKETSSPIDDIFVAILKAVLLIKD